VERLVPDLDEDSGHLSLTCTEELPDPEPEKEGSDLLVLHIAHNT
jgi:hypothetical protein